MATSRTSEVRRQRLGTALREIRRRTGESSEAVGRALGWHSTTVSRYESGKRSVKREHLKDLIAYYRLEREEGDHLLTLWRLAAEPSWWYPYRDIIPPEYAALIDLESDAATIRDYSSVVPGLLQTSSYARALISSGQQEISEDEIERRVEVRMQRQRILSKPDAPRFWAVMDEAGLRRDIGGTEVMREQLNALLEAMKRERVTIQVVPFSVGAHPATAGNFMLLELSNHKSIVYLETVAGDLYLESDDEVGLCYTAFEHMIGAALDRAGSAKLISTILKELG
ncbi:helix-turn-helix domain-containing protein [Nocardiopsis sp. CNT-189]|uniref:helix-turn-helix domain-containing protein n=1 Tax=Nocardiopsis oceanisediminis TaxID=2816862 RepID=UPI003B31E6A1